MTRTVKLMAEYGGDVLWRVDGGDVGPIDPNTLSLPSDVQRELKLWCDRYQETLNEDYPPDSGFASPAEEDAFEIEGRRLWQKLQEVLGSQYKITYYSWKESRLYT